METDRSVEPPSSGRRSATDSAPSDVRRRSVRSLAEMKPESRNPVFENLLSALRCAARSDAPILLRGETGTGKTTFAELVHGESNRRGAPFVTVNCPTLTEASFASVLFGQCASDTGTAAGRMGLVEAAEGGTLFFDKVGEIPAPLQAKLLRFLQERRYERVGENKVRSSNIRIVSATGRDIEDDIAHGRFRQDLFLRLDVVAIGIPSLRDRPDDILPLARHFIESFAAEARQSVPHLSKHAADRLCGYAWPGNVRELRNAIERAMILWPGRVLESSALPHRLAGEPGLAPFVGGDFALDELEREHIQRVVDRTPSLEQAAAILHIDITTLWRKRKRYTGQPASGPTASCRSQMGATRQRPDGPIPK